MNNGTDGIPKQKIPTGLNVKVTYEKGYNLHKFSWRSSGASPGICVLIGKAGTYYDMVGVLKAICETHNWKCKSDTVQLHL